MKDKKDKKEKLLYFMAFDKSASRRCIPLGFLMMAAALICTGAVIYFIAFPMEGYIHADFTDTIYWANASVESGKLFSDDFRYAALLPFSANIWFVPLVALFGVSMRAQVAGMIIFAIVMAAAVYFMCRSFKWSMAWTGFTIAAFFMIMSSSEKLREIMWGHVIYYSLILVLLFMGLGLVERLLSAETKGKTVTLALISAIFFALTATDGFQIVAMVALPCAGAYLCERFFDGETRLADKKNMKSWAVVLGILVSTLVGTLLLSCLKGGISADYADGQSVLSPAERWIDHLLALPEAYFELLGFDIESFVPIMNSKSLSLLINVAVGVLLVILPLVLVFNYKKIAERGTRIILWAHLFVTAVTLFGWICGYLSVAEWRLTSMVGSSVAASAASLRFMWQLRPTGKCSVGKRLSAAAATCLALLTLLNFGAIVKMPPNYGRDSINHRIIAKLRSEGLEYGYSTFWVSQTVTLLSDSEIKVRMVLADEEKGVWTDYYQSSRSWYEDQTGIDRYFVILSSIDARAAKENESWSAFLEENDPHIIYIDHYIVYVFDKNIEI